jgi:predicted small integral membrane protein
MFAWMHWTVPTAVGVLLLVSIIVAVNVVDRYRPGYARKGFMPMATTRGDRVFLSILGSVLIFLLWMMWFPETNTALGFLVVIPYSIVMMQWGSSTGGRNEQDEGGSVQHGDRGSRNHRKGYP